VSFPYEAKILVVDDMSMTREQISSFLKEIGYQDVAEAPDGRTAWRFLENSAEASAPFDLILCDINMPEMNGIELLEKVRSHPILQGIPFVMITAESEQQMVLKAMKTGVNSYLVKPLKKDVLLQKLEEVYQRTHGDAA
jgi:two-component system chemotaxis response regulator CheY